MKQYQYEERLAEERERCADLLYDKCMEIQKEIEDKYSDGSHHSLLTKLTLQYKQSVLEEAGEWIMELK
jgi:hypothetical protein